MGEIFGQFIQINLSLLSYPIPSFFFSQMEYQSSRIIFVPLGKEHFNQIFEFWEFQQHKKRLISFLLRRNCPPPGNHTDLPRKSAECLLMLSFPVSVNAKIETMGNSLPAVERSHFSIFSSNFCETPNVWLFVK